MLEGLTHALTHLARCSVNGDRARAQHRLHWMRSVGIRDGDGFSQEVLDVAAAGPWQSLCRAGLGSRGCFHWPAAKEVLMGII